MVKEPMYKCPSFIGCAAPVCPLESAYQTRDRFRLAGESECVATKRTRFKLGKGLKYHGLFAKEYQGMARMGSLDRFQADCLGRNPRIAQASALKEGLKGQKEEK